MEQFGKTNTKSSREFSMSRGRTAFHVAFASAVAALLPTAAWAHPGHDAAGGFLLGFVHPVAGLDHVLAMVAVGMLAAGFGRRAVWALPLTFVVVMATGSVLGVLGIGIPFVEAGIAISVIVLGLGIGLQWKWPVATAMTLVGIFAIFHGEAHGAEMPIDVSGLAYGLGFLLATAMLHVLGIGFSLSLASLGRSAAPGALRLSGAAMAVAGAGILTGVI
jgi:urease accessory protein